MYQFCTRVGLRSVLWSEPTKHQAILRFPRSHRHRNSRLATCNFGAFRVGYIFEDDMWTKLRRAESAYGFKFRSVPDSVPQYELTLRGQDDSPQGTLTVFQIDGKTAAYTHNFTASRVPTGSLRCSFARRYSNVRSLAEEGESTGVEILTFCTGDRLTGLVSFHEGYWGEPTFVLLAMRNVEQKSPGDLSFQLNVEDTIVGYHLKSQGSVAFLSRDNSEYPDRVRLIRRLPVFSFPKK